MNTSVRPLSISTGTVTTRARRGYRSRSWMFGSSSRRAATASSWAFAVRWSSESNSGIDIIGVPPGLRPRPRPQPEHGERAALEVVHLAGSEDSGPIRHLPVARVERGLPAHAGLVRGQDERNGLVVGVQQDEEGVADDGLAHVVHLLDRVAGQSQADRSVLAAGPVVVDHFLAVRAEPGQVLRFGAEDVTAVEERAPAEHR